jgi:mono/diheme cytochrome c family protein
MFQEISHHLLAAFALWLAVNASPAGAQDRGYDPNMLEQGLSLYRANCAICHGQNAEGTVKNWQERDADGKLPPPPLNGTAHTWHHPVDGLALTIRNGTRAIGGNMPPWKDKLSNDEIFAIIIWLTSLWPDEIYQTWLQRNNL